ncbi:MAG: hypothetical protein JWR77_2628 [Rhizorhabdus sp.]|nr:hypothetical protein [Rhizorhabdus sp.]
MDRQKTIKSSDDSPSRTGSRPTTIRPSISMNADRHGLPEVHLFEFTGSGLRCDVLFGDAS